MSLDAVPEQEAILAHAAILCNGRIYDSLPDETKLEFDAATGLVRPYIIISFGSLYPLPNDRTIEGAEQQPNIMPVIAECWGPTSNMARATAGAYRTRFVGFHPSENNASELELRGGGWFEQKDASGRPVRYCETVTGQTILNMSIDAA